MSSFIWLIITFVPHVACETGLVELRTRLGTVIGNSFSGEYQEFLGVPYAKPPVGDLRFQKPKPFGKFNTKKWSATKFGSRCTQFDGDNLVGSEDCLYLNIYQPAVKNAAKRAVMIWLHGGGFIKGSSNLYPGGILAHHGDVIVVTLNYRLSIFGFLTNSRSNLPGNYGLWDQKLAIHWVKDNIEDYGGDSNSITLFGGSAGGRSVSYQMFSPHNTMALFQKGIVQSGSALSITEIILPRQPDVVRICQHLNCSPYFSTLQCLQNKSTAQLMEAGSLVQRPYPFFPVIDNDFLPDSLGTMLFDKTWVADRAKLAKNIGDFKNYHLLAGWNVQEGLFYLNILKQVSKELAGRNHMEGISSEILSAALKRVPFYGFQDNNETLDAIVLLYTKLYLNSHNLLSRKKELAKQRIEAYANVAGDVAIKIPVINLLMLHSQLANANTYAYEFQRKTPMKTRTPDISYWLKIGATHADEIPYVFGHCLEKSLIAGIICTKSEIDISKKIMDTWTSFAEIGHPGNDFKLFKHPHHQTYTVINGSDFKRDDYPHNLMALFWSNVEMSLKSGNQKLIERWTTGEAKYDDTMWRITVVVAGAAAAWMWLKKRG